MKFVKVFSLSEMFWIIFGALTLSASSLPLPSKFEIVVPSQLHPTRHRRDLSTFTQDGHLQNTSYSFKAMGRNFVVDLYLNSFLLHKDYFEAYQLPDGNLTENKVVEHCYYHGTISGKLNTSAVFSTCDGLSGTIQDQDGKRFGMQPRESSSMEHMFYDMEDLPKSEAKCGLDDTAIDLHWHHGFENHLRVRRATTPSKDEKKYISLAIVNDKRQFEKQQSNLTLVVRRALEVANYVDQLYKTINTRAAVVYVETWNVVDLSHVSTSASDTLGQFGKYNKDVLAKKLSKTKIRRDNAQLISGIRFTGSIVGMAGMSNICGLDSSGVNVDRGHPSVTAATLAHELGHNLGMGHDSGGCACSKGPCVMAAVSGGAAYSFTSCSKDYLDKRVTNGLGSCLFDVPEKLFSKPVCGNDFLEAGEQCDCGTVAECNATGAAACCNATTCTLHGHAKCAVGPCCSGCQFKTQGAMCRNRQTECDLEEVCTGKSQECPGNFYRQDGTPCNNDTAYCFEGGCRTHVEQCAALWGKGTQMGHDLCYDENTAGTEWSNCGQNELKQYKKCQQEDVKCGTVQCMNTANRFPIVGTSDAARTLNHYVSVNGVEVTIQCRQGLTNLGADLDNPTLVQQGTRCGDGKICIARQCVNLTSLDFIVRCPNNSCYNGGVCNNMGNCHCPVGFACPNCKHSGPGGSIDSGSRCYVPVTDGKSGLSTLAKSMLILFLGVLPLVIIIIVLLYKFRSSLPCRVLRKPPQQQAKPSSSRSQDKNFGDVPAVSFHRPPATASAPPVPSGQTSNPSSSYTNRTFANESSPLPPIKAPGTPGRAPPRPPPSNQPSIPAHPSFDPPPPYAAKPLKPVKPMVSAPLPPVRPGNSPAGPIRPAKLPPVVPKKPPTK